MPTLTHTELSLLIRAGDFWWVSDELGKEYGALRAKVENNEVLPPVNGWQYYGRGNWLSDSTLVCSREVSTACEEVVVHLEGRAKEKWPMCGGRYLPLKGKMNTGRWVGSLSTKLTCNCHCVMYERNIDIFNGIDWLQVLQHASGSERYLRVPTGSTRWAIGPTIDEAGSWIASGSAGGLCPAKGSNSVSEKLGVKNWRYADNGKFVEGNIVLKCITHSW